MNWYVVCYEEAHQGSRGAALSGPYATQEAADAMVSAARNITEEIDLWSVFYTFGVAALDRDMPGVLEQLGYFKPEQLELGL